MSSSKCSQDVIKSYINRYNKIIQSVNTNLKTQVAGLNKSNGQRKLKITNREDLNTKGLKIKGSIYLYFLNVLNPNSNSKEKIWISDDKTGHQGSEFKVYFEEKKGYRLVCSVDVMGKCIAKGDKNCGCLIKRNV